MFMQTVIVVVVNIGTHFYELGFSLSFSSLKNINSRPFSVIPSFGALEVGESIQVTVVFQPIAVGIHQQDLRLHYHTGEIVFFPLILM